MRLLSFSVLLIGLLAACGSEPSDSAPPVDEVATPVAPAADVAPSDSATYEAFEDVMAYAREHDLAERPIGEVAQEIGVQLLGRPYLAGMLDEAEQEALVVDLMGFDCVTYVENVVALAQAVKAGDPSYATYVQNLESLRYRGGTLDGYCSRLHYFSDWMLDNERRGNVEIVSRDFGEPFDKTIDFMSGHRDAYPKLVGNDSLYACIQQVEAGLADHGIFYVPQDQIRSVYDRLRAGDIIATATNIDGLDVTHTGFVYKHDDGRTGFLHASLSGEVKISDDLADYVNGVKAQTGIIVARPLAPGTAGSPG